MKTATVRPLIPHPYPDCSIDEDNEEEDEEKLQNLPLNPGEQKDDVEMGIADRRSLASSLVFSFNSPVVEGYRPAGAFSLNPKLNP